MGWCGMGDWPEEIDQTMIEVIAAATNNVVRRYREWVERDDVKSELYLYAWRNRKAMRSYLDRDDEVDRRRGWKAALISLERAGERYARKEKAAKSGYWYRDEFFYDAGLVGQVIEADAMSSTLKPDETGRHHRGDPSTGGNFLAMKADVLGALSEQDDQDRELLTRFYGHGETATEIAESLDISRQAVEKRLEIAMNKVVSCLGGVSPWVS